VSVGLAYSLATIFTSTCTPTPMVDPIPIFYTCMVISKSLVIGANQYPLCLPQKNVDVQVGNAWNHLLIF
jgi:hypothetical protein